MRYLSVCAGIEAASVAWHELGWTPVAFSEIEPFPCAVLKHHYPDVQNWGDMTKFKEWPDADVNVLIGGTPCQSFSVAGLRKGLADPRGNLALTYLAIADKYRPAWVVWENVPGVLSSGGGRDFAAFLGGLGELGYGWAYRVLDAQYFGVAQRRRRVFVVGYLGNWAAAAAVLFERESLQGHPAPSRQKREGAARSTTHGIGTGGDPDVMATLCAKDAEKWGCNQWVKEGKAVIQPVAQCLTSLQRLDPTVETLITTEVAETLIASDHKGPGHNRDHNFIAQPITFGAQMSEPQTDVDMVQTLQATNPMAVAIQDVRDVEKAQNGRGWNDDGSAYTVDTHATQGVAVAQPIPYDLYQVTAPVNRQNRKPGDPCHTLARDNAAHAAVAQGAMQVRRLTCVECERLQGFPDNYTAIPWRNKPADQCPDGPRYKALGNSMAVPVIKWLGERIQMVNDLMNECEGMCGV